MQTRLCESPGCTEAATLRQLGQVDPAFPRYLCAHHWNDLRMMHPTRASMYGSLRVLGPLNEEDVKEEDVKEEGGAEA